MMIRWLADYMKSALFRARDSLWAGWGGFVAGGLFVLLLFRTVRETEEDDDEQEDNMS